MVTKTETNTCAISIPDNIGLSQTANLPAKLKLCVGATVMLTDNISVSDRLINGLIGTVKHLKRRSKPLCSTIYVKFDDPKAGNSMKDRSLCGICTNYYLSKEVSFKERKKYCHC